MIHDPTSTCVAQSQVNPVQHQIDVVRSQMRGLTQSMASFRLAYEEAHGPGSSSDLSALGDLATERAKRPIDAGLMWTFLRLVQGEPTFYYSTSSTLYVCTSTYTY